LVQTRATSQSQDYNGHVNVRGHYGLHIDAAEAALMGPLGIDQEWLSRVGQSLFSATHHLQFHAEILVGDDLEVFLRLLDRPAKALHAMSILFDKTTGRVASTLEFVDVYVDLSTRRATTMPADLTQRTDAILRRHAQSDWQLPLSRPLATSRPRP
jgi:acyl-CoA thioesterase FadM